MSTVGTASVKIKPDFSTLNADLARQINPIASQFGNRFGKALDPVMAQQSKHLRTFTTGAKYGAVGAAGLAAVIGKDLVQAGAGFEKQMSVNAAVSEANSKQLAKLEKQSIKLGQATFYSASEAAEAQGELIKGGLKVKQVLGGGLPAALHLAEAGQLDLATAAETTVNAMKLFGLQGKEANSVADMLATAANRTTADVLDFAMAMKQGGSVSKLAGYDMNETVTVLEALAESGIKNSDAGTSMKTAVIHLLNPLNKQKELIKELNLHFVDQQGHLKSAVGISEELRRATGDMTKAERAKDLAILAGTDGVRTLNALYSETPKELEALERANAKQGTAQDIAAKKMDNLAGEWEQFKGSLETTEIQIYKGMAPALKDLTHEATEAANRVGNVFDNPNLSGSEKVQRAAQVLADELGRMFDKYHVEDHLIEGLDKFLNDAVPRIAENAGKLGFEFAKGFVDGFTHADLLGKLVMGTWLLHFIGGKAPFIAIGKSMGKTIGINLAEETAKTAAPLIAAETAAATRAAATAAPVWSPMSPALGSGAARRAAADATSRALLEQSFGAFTLASPAGQKALEASGRIGARTYIKGFIADARGRLPELKATTAEMAGRFGRGLATYGLGGLVVGEMSKEIVGGNTGQELAAAFQGAGAGAAIGTAIAPGIGTAIGAALGSIGGSVLAALGEDGKSLGDEYAEQIVRGLQRHWPKIKKQIEEMQLGRPGHVKASGPFEDAFGGELQRPRIGESGLRGVREKLRDKLQIVEDLGGSEKVIAALRAEITKLTQVIHSGEKAITDYRHGFDLLKSGVITRMGDINKITQENVATINQVWKDNPPKWHQAMAQSMKASIAAIRSGMKQGVIETDVGQERIKQLMRNLRLFEGRDPLGLAKGFSDSWVKAGQVTNQQIQSQIRELNKLPKGAREAAREAMVGMARKLESEGKLVKGSAARLNSALATKFGQTNKQVQQSTARAMAHIAQSAEDGATNVGRALSNVFDNLDNALAAVGSSKVPTFSLSTLSTASQYHATRESTQSGFGDAPQKKQAGGNVHRQGFVVPGAGDGDRFKTPGEVGGFVLNREATAAYKLQDGGVVPLALEAGERYFTKREVQAIGRQNLEALNKSVPRFGFQSGGIVEPKLQGPEPLRSLGQTAIHMVNQAAKAYLEKHRPHGGPGYSGPPIGPAGTSVYKGVLMATWVKQALEYAAAHGSGDPRPTSGYRSHAENVAAGRTYFSEHEKTRYPGGAVDFGGYVDPAAYAAKMAVVNATRGFKYPLLAPIGFRDDGHASGTGHQLGGLVQAIQRLADGGFVKGHYTVKGIAASAQQMHTAREIFEAADDTGAGHLPRVASMMAATQESNMGSTGNTFQLTSTFEGVSPSDDAYKQAVQWFTKGYYHGGGIGLAKKFSDPGDIAQEVEGSAYPDNYDPWKAEGQKWTDGWRSDGSGSGAGGTSKIPAEVPYHEKGGVTGSDGGTTAPSKGHVKTEKLPDFGSLPDTLPGVRRELGKRRAERGRYRAALSSNKDPDVRHALKVNISLLRNRIHALIEQQKRLVRKAHQEAITKRITQRGTLPGFEQAIASAERSYDISQENAEQILGLEPEEGPAAKTYIEGKEAPAWAAVLGSEAHWRNTLISGEFAATARLRDLEAQEERINALKFSNPKAFNKQKYKLPAIHKAIAAVRELYTPPQAKSLAALAAGNFTIQEGGSFYESLVSLQGVGKSNQPLDFLPSEPVPGAFGGLIWDTQMQIRELGLKIKQAGEGGEDNSELLDLERELRRQAEQRAAVSETQRSTIDQFLKAYPLPQYHQGGVVPGPPGREEIALLRGQERVRTPEQEVELAEAISGLGGVGSAEVKVIVKGDIVSDAPDPVEVLIGDRRFRAEIQREIRSTSAGRGLASTALR